MVSYMEFDGKLALVTGGASGIGAATTRLLAQRGARVFAVDLNQMKLDAIIAELGPAVIGHMADLAEASQVTGMVEAAVTAMGGLDILISNAGVGSTGRAGEVDPQEWRRVMAINLDATFLAARAALPQLIQRRGSIVATASVSGVGADYGTAIYNTAKAGLLGLVRNMALDYAANGVRVNAVSPGFTATAMADRMNSKTVDAFLSVIPLARAGTSKEIAEVICFLASDRASYITGQNIIADGGVMAHTGFPKARDYT
jgi:meso-butanediol dehydrogenase/(S,S)-butanediol dehydrogenase/diacetyl reductase